MLTGFQVETVAYLTEYGDLLCPDCFAIGDEYAKPVIRYSLDEWQSGTGEDWCAFTGWNDDERRQECGCEPPVCCEGCGNELLEAYEDFECPNQDDFEDRQ